MDKGVAIVARNADELVAAAIRQLQLGADLVKLYVQTANSNDSPWTAAEVKRVTDAVHARGAIVTAHAMRLGPAQAAVFGGVDGIEHGFRLDADVRRDGATGYASGHDPGRAAVVVEDWRAERRLLGNTSRAPLRDAAFGTRRGKRAHRAPGGCRDLCRH